MNNSGNRFRGLGLLAIGVLVGGLAFSQFNATTGSTAFSGPETTTSAPAPDRAISSLRDLNNAFVEIAARVNPAVVTVFTEKVVEVPRSPFSFPYFFDPFRGFGEEDPFSQPRGRGRSPQPQPERDTQFGLGSGVIVSSDGYVLTNNHVVREADSIYVRLIDRRKVAARVVGADPKTDIAVLKIDANNLTAIRQGNSDNLRVGEWVLAVGSPLSQNLDHTVTQGIVSAKGRSNVGLADYEDFIQTDAAINPGNSGGALVNIDGELVGINTAIATRSGGFQGIGFAVPVNMANNVMQSLIEHGKVVRGWLGVTIQEMPEAMAEALGLKNVEGILVSGIVENGPADQAGFKEEDLITAIDGKKVTTVNQLRNQISRMAPGTTITVSLLRNGSPRELPVTLGELPEDEAAVQTRQSKQQQLGFAAESLTQSLANRYGIEADIPGVVVTDIDPVSAAARAGLQQGDVIQKINKLRIATLADFNNAVRGLKSGDSIYLQVYREGSKFFLGFRL